MRDRSSALASMCECLCLLTRSARSREADARNDAASSSVGAGVLTNDASHALGCGERITGDLPGVTLASRDTVFLCIASGGVGGSIAPRIAASSAMRSSAGDMAPGDRWMRDVQTLRRTSTPTRECTARRYPRLRPVARPEAKDASSRARVADRGRSPRRDVRWSERRGGSFTRPTQRHIRDREETAERSN